MLRTDRIGRIARRLAWAAGIRNRALILCYHRIAEADPDPWSLCVSPAHFAEHLEVLRRHATLLPLAELVTALGEGRLPRRAVALTFDDGYADNLHRARPLLERHGMSATVFLVTGAIGSGPEFWWDELEQLVSAAEPSPEPLRLTIDARAHAFQVPGAAAGDGPAGRAAADGGPEPGPWRGERGTLYYVLWRLLWPLPADRRRAALDDLWEQTGGQPRLRASHRALSAAEVAGLSAHGLVGVGAHTVSHPVLPWLPAEAQRAEIAQSRAACEALTGRPAAGFAYPHGETSAATAAMVRAAGLPFACTSSFDLAGRRSDPFLLPRIPVQDCDGDAFAKWLFAALAPSFLPLLSCQRKPPAR